MSPLLIALSVVSVLLALLVALQSKRGDLSFMGASSDEGKKYERRGSEQALHVSTIVLSILFTVLSIILLVTA